MFRDVLVIFTAFVFGAFVQASTASAADVAAASCSQPHVQTAIDTAVDGDRVNVPAGNCTWSATVGWANKNIHVSGAGIDRTIITHSGDRAFMITATSKGQFRLSNMTLGGTTNGAVILVTSEGSRGITSGWRIDHLKFNYPAAQRNGILIRGVTYGVIDHNEFVWSQGFAIHVAAFNANDDCTSTAPMGNFINSQPLDLGSANAVFIEDNIFSSTGNGPVTAYDTSSGGARAVFRYNQVVGGFYYSHWTRGCEIGGVVHEIYNNAFIGNSDYGSATGLNYPIRLESGTGVVFNNYLSGYGGSPYVHLDDRRALGGGETAPHLGACDGSKPWDGNFGDPAAPGWPCLGQIGRAPGKSATAIMAGDKQVSAPLYFWNNGLESSCATGGACTDVVKAYAEPAAYVKSTPHPNGEVDFVLNGKNPKPGYSPFAYPHPLTTGSSSGGGSASGPQPPPNVRIVGS